MSVSFRDPILLFNYYPLSLISLLSKDGLPDHELLRGTHIDLAAATRNLEECITYTQYGHIILNALRLSGDATLGLRFGKSLSITHHGLLGVAVLSSATLGDALAVMESYYSLLSPVLVLQQDRAGNEAIVQANEAWPLGPLQPFAIECLFTGLYHNCCHILNQPSFPCHLHLAYHAPDYAARYAEHLDCPVAFQQAANQIRFPAECLDWPLPYANSTLYRQAVTHCQQQLDTLRNQTSLALKLRNLPVVSDQSVLTVEQAAEALHISSRTLRRQLAQLGTNYQAVVDRLRAERAATLLRDSAVTIAEVAQRLHFADTANFRKAFRRWFGCTPQDYRHRLLSRIGDPAN